MYRMRYISIIAQSLYYYSFYHTYQGTVLAVRYRYR